MTPTLPPDPRTRASKPGIALTGPLPTKPLSAQESAVEAMVQRAMDRMMLDLVDETITALQKEASLLDQRR